jgi:hypothetical protein
MNSKRGRYGLARERQRVLSEMNRGVSANLAMVRRLLRGDAKGGKPHSNGGQAMAGKKSAKTKKTVSAKNLSPRADRDIKGGGKTFNPKS